MDFYVLLAYLLDLAIWLVLVGLSRRRVWPVLLAVPGFAISGIGLLSIFGGIDVTRLTYIEDAYLYWVVMQTIVSVFCIMGLRRMKGIALRTALPKRLLLIMLLLGLPYVPYGIVDVQTAVYGPSLNHAVLQIVHEDVGEYADVSLFKVLGVWRNQAKVYIEVSEKADPGDERPSYGSAWVISLENGLKGWRKGDETTIVWTNKGNAHGSIFPYY